ncbi:MULTISPECIES: asparagine synthetase B [Flammeovirga]|uniref:Asparagine synthetase B n=1 Tax=Flammeovirga agarivorans TaxID=2726742 RepID=A0A7X8XV95_9BACT|nr:MULTISPECIES: asparagine synthetase B [Flammeovirga]NLR91009.1 asparagine synthetase B [Flammeovirga agarivorans]
MKTIISLCFLLLAQLHTFGSHILVPMDQEQTNHLKAYGVTFWVLGQEVEADWLLNYRGGSFMFKNLPLFEQELVIRGVSYDVISDAQAIQIKEEIAHPESNMDLMRLDAVPSIAVYSPPSKQPWDDAVTLVLTYAEIPYDVIFDDEVMADLLPKYDWLHLHHEDFTGQYGKFYATYGREAWYIEAQNQFEESAKRHGFEKVSHLKSAVVKKIRDFCAGGGFLFAMCSATDTYDIALAADNVDICDYMYDGDGVDENVHDKLNYKNTFAFKDFKIKLDPYQYEYSQIDNQSYERGLREENDYFELFTFSAKWDPVPTMLTQNHEKQVKGFMGQTTAFKKHLIKSDVIILGECEAAKEARYIHGTYGKGTWTFFGGHDPEDYRHFVGEEPTDLNLHPNSPGYRLILNNILFPAAKKKKQKT